MKKIMYIILCGIILSACNNNKTKYQIKDIQLKDSLIHQNVFEKTVGIPTIQEMRYKYEINLVNDTSDTTIIMVTRAKFNINDFIGDSVAIYK